MFLLQEIIPFFKFFKNLSRYLLNNLDYFQGYVCFFLLSDEERRTNTPVQRHSTLSLSDVETVIMVNEIM